MNTDVLRRLILACQAHHTQAALVGEVQIDEYGSEHCHHLMQALDKTDAQIHDILAELARPADGVHGTWADGVLALAMALVGEEQRA